MENQVGQLCDTQCFLSANRCLPELWKGGPLNPDRRKSWNLVRDFALVWERELEVGKGGGALLRLLTSD
jgi:hypothetical protein